MLFMTLSAHSMVRAATMAPSLLLRVMPVQAPAGTCDTMPMLASRNVDSFVFIIIVFDDYRKR